MSFELANEQSSPKVEHFFSPVVECIALLSSYIQPEQHTYAIDTHQLLEAELSMSLQTIRSEWKLNWDFMELYNFFIPCPYFHDIVLFTDKMNQLSHAQFLYYLFSEAFTEQQIGDLLADPPSITTFRDEKQWLFGIDEPYLIKLFAQIEALRQIVNTLLKQIYHSATFQTQIRENEAKIQAALTSTRQLELEPMALAQHVMGKVFRRVSNYQAYVFIPSYFLSPHRVRIFDANTCMVMYGCTEDSPNVLEESLELEKGIKALSDQTRLLILRRLGQSKEYGAKLAESLDLTTATISHHLDILKQADLIQEEKVGNIKYFSLYQERFKALMNRLKGFIEGIETDE